MQITGIGINGDVLHLGGSLTRLEEDLSFFQQCGFDGIELSVDGLDAMIGGRLQPRQVDRIQAITGRYDLVYTVHPPGRLNLAFPQEGSAGLPDLAMERAVFVACLDFCAAIGAAVLVYHSGLIGLNEAAFGLGPLPDGEALEAARAQEVAELRALMPLAAERGVTVGMENRDPHAWEVAALRRAGKPPGQLLTYHAGLSVPALLRQVNEVGHPALGLTLDVGHLYLAARQCGFDYLEAVRQAGPHVRHIHLHDNLGRLGGAFEALHERIPYGEGDLHLPPGWGSIPLAESLACLGGYEGFCILEIRPRWRVHCAEGLRTARQIINQVAEGRS